MKRSFLFLVFLPLLLELSSCCKGGTGGHASLTCTVFHHAKPIPAATVYIKYNATDFPGTDASDYDAHITAGNNTNQVMFDNLNCGNYYLYGVGYDSALMLPVTGGIHYQIKYSDRKSAESTAVPVTE